MAKKDGVIEIEGTIIEALPNAMFRVEPRKRTQGARPSRARCGSTTVVLPQDRVVVELSPYDLSRGRIVFRCTEQHRRTTYGDAHRHCRCAAPIPFPTAPLAWSTMRARRARSEDEGR